MNQQAISSASLLSTIPFAGLKMSTPLSRTRNLSPSGSMSMSGSPKTTKRLPPPAFNSPGHVQVRVHARLQDRDAAEALKLLCVGLEVEGAGDHEVESGIGRLAGAGDQIGAADRAVFGADEDTRAALGLTFLIAALGGDPLARPCCEAVELDRVFLANLVHPGLQEGSP